jgi:hypothetical protein
LCCQQILQQLSIERQFEPLAEEQMHLSTHVHWQEKSQKLQRIEEYITNLDDCRPLGA